MVSNGACIIFCTISFFIGGWITLLALSLCAVAKDKKSEADEDDRKKFS